MGILKKYKKIRYKNKSKNIQTFKSLNYSSFTKSGL